MGRKRIYQHHSIPGTVVVMVQAMIQDYPRRKRIIEYSAAKNDLVNEECIRLNKIVDDAISVDEHMLSSLIVKDIISNRSYYHSEATNISSKDLYYRIKRKLIEDIAIKCNLL